MEFLVAIAICVFVSGASALVLDRFWPHALSVRLALFASLPVPAFAVTVLMIILVTAPQEAHSPDDRGMVVASLIAAVPLIVILCFTICFAAASSALFIRRRA